jgi:DNA ligase 1
MTKLDKNLKNLVLRMIFVMCALLIALSNAAAQLTPKASTPAASTPAASTPIQPILLANVLGEDVDVTQYLVSEKYDGVRAVWDGRVMRFRSGNTVNAPDWFLKRLPASPLDGELWIGRGQFEVLSGAVRKNIPIDDEWKKITYMVFEEPNGQGAFTERIDRLKGVIEAANWSQLKLVAQTRVADRLELKKRLNEVVKNGGEGLMLHLADSPYVTGRSNVLLKLKVALDTEAIVVKHIAGKGKYAGMMGALEVKTPDGIIFKIGTGFSDAIRKNPPPVGATITYTYRDLTKNGVPRFASFLRARVDP